jgi:uncharacterized protein YdaU (DUF1376 family)
MTRVESKPLDWYQWHWQIARADRRWQRCSWQARGVLREIFDEAWKNGGVPDDDAAIAEIVGCSRREIAELRPQLMTLLFEVAPGILSSRRLEKIRSVKDRLRAARARAGRLGGFAATSGRNPSPQGDLLADAEPHGKEEKSRGEKRREEKDKDVVARERSKTNIVELWNAMAARLRAAKVVAIKGKRAIALDARIREPGWTAAAIAAIDYLGSDSWYAKNPDAIRFDVLLRPGKAEEYVERSFVPRNGSNGSARLDRADAEIARFAGGE